jgi:hypothetical protein
MDLRLPHYDEHVGFMALDLVAEINRVTPACDDPAEDLAFMWDPTGRVAMWRQLPMRRVSGC